ncbi:MAG: NUDIX domain-containing protein [Bacteroidales bacterium]|nr:NUDIX domain-containing protein [Bacteroidales bacterium]MBN2818212.1 NUDIX domain-containing protein [Bacteroidales bacterium]
MYKVFFNDRAVFLTDDFSKNFQTKYGLFFKYKEKEDLEEIIEIYSKITRINSLIIFHYNIEELQESFLSCFIRIDAAGGLVKNKKGEYLFIYRRGKWDLPKGKVDKNESYQAAAVREVQEETGLRNIELRKPLMSTYHTYPFKKGIALKKTFWFEMEFNGNETPIPQTTEDIEEVRWFKPDELEVPMSNTYGLIKDIFIYLGLFVEK